MPADIEELAARIQAELGERAHRYASLPDELAIEVGAGELLEVGRTLRDHPDLSFEMLVDLAGVDYLDYGRAEWRTNSATATGFSRGVNRAAPHTLAGDKRFAVVSQLLSVRHNRRIRVRVWCEELEDPVVDSVTSIWAGAEWFEREAFDLFGILFRGHPDMRRILTDYGFIGHPFRKDFPLIGNVEVRYDPQLKRVVYEPVSIEPRTLVPRVIRHDNRYNSELQDVPLQDRAATPGAPVLGEPLPGAAAVGAAAAGAAAAVVDIPPSPGGDGG
ncbi:MAG TPA: NADH-quinone oxidoreductase subunit C [Steroidobacteraceae bacterium]|nr:NADH-quinone oxidoreductase subunit C [Steroidobacteraceae bacterium]